MQLNNMNNDILRIIIKYSLYAPFPGFESWKDSFMLLSICSRWRQLGAPIVYKTAYVVHSDDELEMGFGPEVSPDGCENQSMVTNVGLANSNNYAHFVRHADIKVFFASEPLAGLEKIFHMLQSVSASWKRITELTLSLNHDIMSPELGQNEKHTQKLQMPQTVLMIMPNLTKLRFRGTSVNTAVQDFYGQLTSFYSPRLKQLHSRHPIHLSKNIQFMQLTRLDIRFSSNAGYTISQDCATPLVYLSLRGVPPNYEWVQFSKLNGTRSIAFPNLETLRINYLLQENSTLPSYQLPQFAGIRKMHFPKLKKLGLWNDNSNCLLLTSAIFPRNMTCIEFVGSSYLLQLINKIGLPNTEKLVLTTVNTTPASLETTVPSINKILGKASSCKDIQLVILEETIPINVKTIEWTAVTYLQLATYIDMDVSLELLKRLPKLNQLIFYNFNMVNVPSEAFTILENKSQVVCLPPLNTSLVKLMVDYDRQSYSDDTVMSVITYLSLRLPSLKVLGAWISFDAALADFIDNYKSVYPHLNDLVFKLGMVE